MCRNPLPGLKECGWNIELTGFENSPRRGLTGSPNWTIPEGFIHVETDTVI